nr:PREDICTED: solute carrier family 25 member 45 isoform X2 [Rhinolophus sinicus]
MPVEEFVAGWISGALGLVLGHPFDTVKVRLQTQNTYRGIVDCMVKTYRHESILGFFKGMSFPIASIAVVNSVLFGVYSNSLLVLTATSHQERRAQPPSYTHVFIAGCIGGFLQAYCLAPFDLIKVRLQNQTEPRAQPGSPPPRYRGPVHCAASIFQEEGPRGLFRGAWALTLRDTPTLGIYFVTYEWLCRQSTPDGQNPIQDADGRAEAEGVPGAAGLHGEQRPAGRTGGLLPGADHQQCPRLSCERCHLPQLRVPPPRMGMR